MYLYQVLPKILCIHRILHVLPWGLARVWHRRGVLQLRLRLVRPIWDKWAPSTSHCGICISGCLRVIGPLKELADLLPEQFEIRRLRSHQRHHISVGQLDQLTLDVYDQYTVGYQVQCVFECPINL
jgi:hypothetical protein